MTPRIADTVVYRHRCHCDNANQVPAEGEHDEHRFDVDGEPFPWHITEQGAQFEQRHDLFLVTVDVMLLERGTNRPVPFGHDWCVRAQPTLGGVEFPWTLAAPVRYVVEDRDVPLLTLTFVASNLDTDGPVTLAVP